MDARLKQFVTQIRHADAGIRARAVQNIASKLRHGLLDKRECGGHSLLMEALVGFFEAEGGGPGSDAGVKVLELLHDFSAFPASARLLLRVRAVAVLERYRGAAPPKYRAYLDAVLANLLTIRSTGAATLHAEVEAEIAEEAEEAAAERRAREGDRLKLALRDRIRQRRPGPSEAFFADLRAKIAHSNPELAHFGAVLLHRYVTYQLDPLLWIAEGNVLLEACEAAPLLVRRAPLAVLDEATVILHIETLARIVDRLLSADVDPVQKESMASMIAVAFAGVLAGAPGGVLRCRVLEAMTQLPTLLRPEHFDAARDAGDAKRPGLAPAVRLLLNALGRGLLAGVGEAGCGPCSPASLLEAAQFARAAEAALAQPEAATECLRGSQCVQTHPARAVLDLLTLARVSLAETPPGNDGGDDDVAVPVADVDNPTALALSGRHPGLYQRLVCIHRAVAARGVYHPAAAAGPTAAAVGDAELVADAMLQCASPEGLFDALSAGGALACGVPQALYQTLEAPSAFDGLRKFFSAPPGGSADAGCVAGCAGYLAKVLASPLLRNDVAEAVADLVEYHLLPTMRAPAGEEEGGAGAAGLHPQYIEGFPAAVEGVLALVDVLFTTLRERARTARVVDLATRSGLLAHLTASFLAPAAGCPPTRPRSALEWAVTDYVPSSLLKFTSRALRIATTLAALLGHAAREGVSPPGLVAEVQDVLSACTRFLTSDPCPEELITAGRHQHATFMHQWADCAAVCAAYLATAAPAAGWRLGVDEFAFAALARAFPRQYYAMAACRVGCGQLRAAELAGAHPGVVAEAVAAVGETAEAAAFLTALLGAVAAHEDGDEAGEVDAAGQEAALIAHRLRDELSGTLFDVVLPALVAAARRAREAAPAAPAEAFRRLTHVLHLLTAAARRDRSFVSPSWNIKRVATWGALVAEAAAAADLTALLASAPPKAFEAAAARLGWVRAAWGLIAGVAEAERRGGGGDAVVATLLEAPSVPLAALAERVLEAAVVLQRFREGGKVEGPAATCLCDITNTGRGGGGAVRKRDEHNAGEEVLPAEGTVSEHAWFAAASEADAAAHLALLFTCQLFAKETWYVRAGAARAPPRLARLLALATEVLADGGRAAAARAAPCALLATGVATDAPLFAGVLAALGEMQHARPARPGPAPVLHRLLDGLVGLAKHAAAGSPAHDALAGVLCVSPEAKAYVLHGEEGRPLLCFEEWVAAVAGPPEGATLGEVLMTLEKAGDAPAAPVAAPPLGRAVFFLTSVLRELPAPGAAPAWGAPLAASLRALLPTVLTPRPTRVAYRLAVALLKLAREVLVLPDLGAEGCGLYRDIVRSLVAHLGGRGAAALSGVGLELLGCVGAAGRVPKYLELIAAPQREQFFASIGTALAACVAGDPGAAAPILAALAELALAEAGQEGAARVPDLWDVVLGTPQHAALLAAAPAEALLLLRNLAFRPLNKTAISRDPRVPPLFLELLQSTRGDLGAVKEKWLVLSALWALLYNNEKVKPLWRPVLAPHAVAQVLAFLERHRAAAAGDPVAVELLGDCVDTLRSVVQLLA